MPLSSTRKAQLLSLPSYPFQRSYLWQDNSKQEVKHEYPLYLYETDWTNKEFDSKPRAVDANDWLVYSDAEGLADQVVAKLKLAGENVIVVEISDRYKPKTIMK